MQEIKNFISELFWFGWKEALSCAFAGSFFLILFLSHHIHLQGISRYDFIFIFSIIVQILLVISKLETVDELKVISLFHIIGLVLELYKTHPAIGSWSYPEECFFKIGGVPLYSGFMYAAVGSYICQAWRIFKLRLINFENRILPKILCCLIYLNFFTNHFIYDFRLILIALIFMFFYEAKVLFTITKREYSMPLTLSFILIAFFIWLAENIATFLGAWKYKNQLAVWNVVSYHKISSWFLLVIISFIIVAELKYLKTSKAILNQGQRQIN
jgi:uncharacterized membrane protein YoaT (DUF817 family)